MTGPAADAFAEVVRRALAAFNRTDYETAFAGVADEVVWEFGDWVFDAGEIHGRDALLRFYARMRDAIDWKVEVIDVREVGVGRFLVHLAGVATGRTTGISEGIDFYAIYELGPAGQVVRVREFESRDEAIAAAQ